MERCTLEAYYRDARVFDKLIDDRLAVVGFFVFQRRKCANRQNVKIGSQYGRSIFYMFDGGTIHDCTIFQFNLPAFTAHIEYDGFHPKIACGYLCTQAGAKRWIQE